MSLCAVVVVCEAYAIYYRQARVLRVVTYFNILNVFQYMYFEEYFQSLNLLDLGG